MFEDRWFWIIIAVIAFFAVCFGAAIYGAVSDNIFTETPVKYWTQSEAIFYGAVVIALALLFSK